MLDNNHIKELVDDLCFELDCPHFNLENSDMANPYALKQWLKKTKETYGDTNPTFQNLVDAIAKFDEKDIPVFDKEAIKAVYLTLISGVNHPKVLITDKGFILADYELIDGYKSHEGSNGMETQNFSELTRPARTRAFVEAIIRKYKPDTVDQLFKLFDIHANGRQSHPKTLI